MSWTSPRVGNEDRNTRTVSLLAVFPGAALVVRLVAAPFRLLAFTGDFDFAVLAFFDLELRDTFRDFAETVFNFLRATGFLRPAEFFFFAFFFLVAIKLF